MGRKGQGRASMPLPSPTRRFPCRIPSRIMGDGEGGVPPEKTMTANVPNMGNTKKPAKSRPPSHTSDGSHVSPTGAAGGRAGSLYAPPPPAPRPRVLKDSGAGLATNKCP